MKPAPFVYRRAHSLDEAVATLARFGDEAKVLAGGQSLVSLMNLRLAQPWALIDVTAIPGLRYIKRDSQGLRIGALTSHAQIERYPLIIEGFEVLQQAARWVGHYPIRMRGTFGGSIAHADPAAEWCLLATLFDAEIVVQGPEGRRAIAAADFFQGFLMTALAPDEVVVEVHLPRGAQRSAVSEFARRVGDFAIVEAAVAFDLDGDCCRRARVALGGVSDRPVRVAEAERVLEGEVPSAELFDEAAQAAGRAIDPPADLHATADYRRFLTAGLVQRCLAEAHGVGSSTRGRPGD